MKRPIKRRSKKANFTTTEKVVLAGGLLFGVWAGWKYLIKPMLNPEPVTPLDTTTTTTTPAPATDTTPVTQTPGEPAFNSNKVMKLNSPPSKELKYSKMAFNSEIELARKKRNDHTLDEPTRTRLGAIADLPLLDIETKFGKETQKVAKVILGKTDFTYNGVKTQKINMWKALGLGNPYN